jgi:hypothetical protein
MKPWIAVALAIATGAASSFVVSRSSGGTPDATATPPTRMVPVADAHAAMDKQRITLLEQRVADLATERSEDGDARSAPPADDRGVATHRDELLSEDETLARHRSSHDALVAAVQAQGTDPTWSAGAEARFTSDLGQLGAHIERVDCRTSACVATLEWPSRAQAQQEYRGLIEARYQLPCDRRIFLDRAVQEDGPYRATLVLDCEHVRASP